MRQVTRPVIRDGKVMRDASGTVITETVVEPVAPGQQGMNNDITTMLLAKVLTQSEHQKRKQLIQLLLNI